MARSLNKVQLIGNLTRDPELRYTPQGTAVCTLGLATNRAWTADDGTKHEEAEFHRIVAWNKLAELCAQLLFKGRRTYVEGRLQTRQWTGSDGVQRKTTEIVISDMILLDSRQAAEEARAAVAEEPMNEKEPSAEKVEEEKEGKEEEKKEVVTAEGVVGEAPVETKPAKKKAKKEQGDQGDQGEGEEKKGEVKKEEIPF